MCVICKNDRLEGLQILDCSDCPLLTSVPHIEGLQKLYCYNCPLLTSVPQIEGLRLNCFGCKWLKTDSNFNESITKLKLLQCWFKKILLSKRLMKLIPQLIPLYYHPDAKGGYLSKRDIFNYFEKFEIIIQ